jgi:hypothetical protein
MVQSFLMVLVIAMPAFAQRPETKKTPPLPEKLTAKPNADPILKLRIELHNTLLDALTQTNQMMDGGAVRGPDLIQTRADLICQLLDVTLEIETDSQRKINAIKGMVDQAVYAEAYLEARRDIDIPTHYLLAKARRLELETRLANYKKSLAK